MIYVNHNCVIVIAVNFDFKFTQINIPNYAV